MFGWGNCLGKLLIGGIFGFLASRWMPIATSILIGVIIYSIISAWWCCCYLLDHVFWGSLLFVVLCVLVGWGCAAAPNAALRVVSYIALAVITLGGVIADIWGMIQAIRGEI